jgi:hypothetical protein
LELQILIIGLSVVPMSKGSIVIIDTSMGQARPSGRRDCRGKCLSSWRSLYLQLLETLAKSRTSGCGKCS